MTATNQFRDPSIQGNKLAVVTGVQLGLSQYENNTERVRSGC
jgi:hypothetical protein